MNMRNKFLATVTVLAAIATHVSCSSPALAAGITIDAPSQVDVGSQATFSLNFALLTGSDETVISVAGTTVTGFGSFEGYSGSETVAPHSQSDLTFNFTTPTLSVPGTIQVGGGPATDTFCRSVGCVTGPPTIPTANISVAKSAAFIALHQQLADASAAQYAYNNIFVHANGALSGGNWASVVAAGANYLSAQLDPKTQTFATLFVTGIGLVVLPAIVLAVGGGGIAATTVGLISISAAGYLSLMGGFFAETEIQQRRLAADPPDSNYTQIYQPGPAAAAFDLGLGADVNSNFNNGVDLLTALLDSQQGELTSIEREQGALLAGDTADALAQTQAAQNFALEYETESLAAGNWFGDLPALLDPYLFEGGFSNIDLFDQSVDQAAADFENPPTLATVDVPEAGSIWFLVAGLLCLGGMALLRRRLRAQVSRFLCSR